MEDSIDYVQTWNVDNTPQTIEVLKIIANNLDKINIVLIQNTGQLCMMGFCDETTTVTHTKFGVCNREKIIFPDSEGFF